MIAKHLHPTIVGVIVALGLGDGMYVYKYYTSKMLSFPSYMEFCMSIQAVDIMKHTHPDNDNGQACVLR